MNKTDFIDMRLLVFLFVIIVIPVSAQKFNPKITVKELKKDIGYLASDELKGRKSGEDGDLKAAEYIRSKFKDAGLELMYDNGFQSFGLVTSAEVGEGNKLEVNGNSFEVEKHFLPYAFSANTTVSANVIFAGFGLDVDRDSLQWNDYKDVDVAGKWVLALQGDPDLENTQSPYIEFSSERSKALFASDKNAAGLILVAGKKFSENDQLTSLIFDKNSARYNIPVIQVTREVANNMLWGKITIEELEAEIDSLNTSRNMEIDVTVSVTINVLQKETETRNVVALLPGTDNALKNEYVIVGAHFDHLGMGGQGSGSRVVDTIAVHNGADDNASGVAAMIQLAEKLAAEKNNKRSIIFVAFGAEEMGLVGSKAFTNKPPVDIEKMTAMFNFDMVGRLDPATNGLSIGGTQTSKESEALLTGLNTGFELAFSPEGVGPSDHASFYLQNIPVFFISTGAHSDYHTPLDDAELINYEGTKKVADYSFLVIADVANRNTDLTFQEAGPKFQRSRGGRLKVTFGIMPDFAGLEKRGLRIDAVTKGKPAFKAGMKKGDIIVAIDGKKVGGIHDYMSRLQTMEVGQQVSVDIIREEKQTVLIVQL
ncbi:MAG TPA: M20/M25/M40 family metallo-hydrolase [Draconibacterium sp.]|nr:M20/M25/M40 family metallo-hydrolase [Draconibacterium sp.]